MDEASAGCPAARPTSSNAKNKNTARAEPPNLKGILVFALREEKISAFLGEAMTVIDRRSPIHRHRQRHAAGGN